MQRSPSCSQLQDRARQARSDRNRCGGLLKARILLPACVRRLSWRRRVRVVLALVSEEVLTPDISAKKIWTTCYIGFWHI